MSATTVIWCKQWPTEVTPAAQCSHEGSDALSINQRLEAAGGCSNGRKIVMDGSFCMACGTDSTGRFTIAEAMHLCMEQHGWNRAVGERLYDLAKFHEQELLDSPAIPIWCFYAFGWSGREIHKALNGGKLKPAHMSEEVEQLAREIRQ
jgi:hypothetical protein